MRHILLFVLILPMTLCSQTIHQEQSDYYKSLGISAEDYYLTNTPRPKSATETRGACTLNKIVYGWHPYWSNGLQVNYDWNLLSHFCYFSYEVDAATGNAVSTHSFSTTASVTDALNNGVRVDLCVTLFSNHATFLTNATARQNLITNLINLISARGAHGVNIDFEGIPASQKTNFTNFMNDLSNQMHAAIPGSHVSSVLYAVDWNDVFDVAAMTSVDFFVIMGYDYYWTGSTTAGPNDPLFHFGSSYNYTLSKSITYYLNKGLPESKLVVGLPYYGREWPVASIGIPSTTTGSGVARFYNDVRDNISGNYSAANRNFDANSYSAYYEFNSGGTRQCFITEEYELEKRMDLINKRGIAGMGIWALGYDDGYNDFWNLIQENFTDCKTTLCYDTIYDIGGGPNKNYYDNEDYTYTISPAGASQITFNFYSFNLENNYDYLYIYDGPTTASPQIAGSPFTGTIGPGTFTSSTGAVTLRFTSDVSTTAPGFFATYQCLADVTPPTTLVSEGGTWKTTDFNVSFTDTDNAGGSGVNEKYYQALDFNGTEWRANNSFGFFNDNFTTAIHPEWTNVAGTWAISTARLNQSDNANANTNLHAPLTQNSSEKYLYHWQMNMNGTGTNRRAGIHFFCDNPSLSNRGNSYFVYFRVDSDKCQIYKVVSDVFTLMTDDDVVVNASTWYDCKVSYDPATGSIKAYLNGTLVSEWTDPSPLTSGNSISLRTGGTSTLYDDVKVYKMRGSSELVTIGSLGDEIRYQNFGLSQNTCRIVSIINDNARNWSTSSSANINIDWTAPIAVATVIDSLGTDIDSQTDNTTLRGEYSVSSDAHSGVDEYWYSIGTSPLDSSVVNWTNNSTNTNFMESGLSLTYGQTYYINVRVKNGAGLISTVSSSDGVTIIAPAVPPVCGFALPYNEICVTDSIQINNTTVGATSYSWSGAGVGFSSTSVQYPYLSFASSGTYAVQLIANGPGGDDTLMQNLNVIVHALTNAGFTASDDTLYLPAGFLACSNTSTDAVNYSWSFGDGNVSTDSDPWNNYTVAGNYEVSLIAGNGFCPNDTAVANVVVLNGSGVQSGNQSESGVVVFPNPADHWISIESKNDLVQLQVIDASGKLVLEKGLANFRFHSLDVSNLAKGMYHLRVITNGNPATNFTFVKL